MKELIDRLNERVSLAKSVRLHRHTLEEFQAKFDLYLSQEDQFKEELKGFTVPKLKAIYSQIGYFSHATKKQEWIDAIVKDLRSYFNLSGVVSGFMGEDINQIEIDKIRATTAEQLESFYNKKDEEKAQKEKALTNPETIAQFNAFVKVHGEEKLTNEQLAQFDELLASVELERWEREQERKVKEKAEAPKNVNFEGFRIHQTKHSKTGEDIFTVLIGERVDKETFSKLRSRAKQMGGYYSRFSNKNANPPIYPGFNFSTMEDAEAFADQSGEKAQAKALENSQEQQEQREAKASEKLSNLAERAEQRGRESLGQERKTNTHRRAAQAQHAEEAAVRKLKFAATLKAIAEEIESGEIKYLKRLNSATQLEELNSILSYSYWLRIRATGENSQTAEINPAYDLRFAKINTPTWSRERLIYELEALEDVKGYSRDSKKLVKMLRQREEVTTASVSPGYTYDLMKATLKGIKDDWSRKSMIEPFKRFERLQRIGIESTPTLRAALRELVAIKQGSKALSEEEAKALEVKNLERQFVGKKIDGFFPTPEPIVSRMLSMAKVFEGETILEPSAGLGHIAEQIRETYPDNDLKTVEVNHSLCEALRAKGFEVEHADFLQTSGSYDVIFMNPPFERGQDIEHTTHAFKMLKPGGRLVSVMAGNKYKQDSQTRDFMEMVEEYGYLLENEEGSFKSAFRSTGVSTVSVYLEKPQEQEVEKEKSPKPETQKKSNRLQLGQLVMF